jgi:lipoate-protein ligase A
MWIDDQVLCKFDKMLHVEVFSPKTTMVVLGSGNDESLEVNLPQCAKLNVPVLRRYGGGGTVVLYSGCVVVSVGCWVKDQFKNNFYFSLLNQAIIDCLSISWPALSALSQAGISDIVMGEKKIAGTSMFRSRNYLLYQASLLVDLDRTLVGDLLRHPTKEPVYRRGRSHGDFLSGLSEVDSSIPSVTAVELALKSKLDQVVTQILREQLIDPIDGQKPSLRLRLQSSAEPKSSLAPGVEQ